MIMVVILLLFGAKRIPEVAASFGKGIKEFKKNINDATREIDDTPPRYENRLNQPDIESRPRTTQQEETRPEPKRLI
jgi:sec-independent protein translocase protein TatA